MFYYIIAAVVAAGGVLLSRSKRMVSAVSIGFFIVQAAMAAYATIEMRGTSLWGFFGFDTLGLTYLCLMAGIGILTAWRSVAYLNSESLRHYKIYFLSLVGLAVSLTGVYLASNIAVTWIFLEATTLATAGLIYHRRSSRALEATWKYIFVSSVGIAVAYLGVLLLSTASPETLSYEGLKVAVAANDVNPLYLRLAFIFILVGYSTKLEIFPLFTVGIDANHSSPSPASAFISSALVGGGFVALLRVYQVIIASPIAPWVGSVLMIVGIASLLAAGVYMGRTGNYKRLLAYSTVENSGIAIVGLALGGVGVFAAVLHSLAHTVIKAVLFLQMSLVGRQFDTYKVGRIGGYFAADRVGAIVIVFGTVALVAAPPSLLFRSEFIIFSQVITSDSWWLIIPIILSLLACAYWALSKLLSIVFAASVKTPNEVRRFSVFSALLILILLGLFVFGVYRSDMLHTLVYTISR